MLIRFMESELELHDEIQQLRAVATVPEHYSLLVDLGTVQSLLGLLSHENTGIRLLMEMFLLWLVLLKGELPLSSHFKWRCLSIYTQHATTGCNLLQEFFVGFYSKSWSDTIVSLQQHVYLCQ